MSAYDGYIFNIISWDNDQVKIGSQFRPELTHTVEYLTQTCTCENFTIDKNPQCKHLRFVNAILKEIEDLKQ